MNADTRREIKGLGEMLGEPKVGLFFYVMLGFIGVHLRVRRFNCRFR